VHTSRKCQVTYKQNNFMFKVTLCHGKKWKKNKKMQHANLRLVDSSTIGVDCKNSHEFMQVFFRSTCGCSLLHLYNSSSTTCNHLHKQQYVYTVPKFSKLQQVTYLFVKYTPASADLPPQPLTRGFAREPHWGHGSHPRPPL